MSDALEGPLEAVRSLDNVFPSSMGNLMPPLETQEGSLSLRFRKNRKSYDKSELVYEFTRDPALLHQYTMLYKAECRVANDPEFQKADEELTRKSLVFVVRSGSLVVGGARITIKTPRHNILLPLEIGEFRLEKVFPELAIRQMRYAEFSRIVLLPDYRADGIMVEMFSMFCRKSIAAYLDVFFAAAPLVNTRMFSYCCNRVPGLEQHKTYREIELPPYPGFEEVKDYLFCIVKNGDYPKVNFDYLASRDHAL